MKYPPVCLPGCVTGPFSEAEVNHIQYWLCEPGYSVRAAPKAWRLWNILYTKTHLEILPSNA